MHTPHPTPSPPPKLSPICPKVLSPISLLLHLSPICLVANKSDGICRQYVPSPLKCPLLLINSEPPSFLFHPTSFPLFPIGLRADLLPPVLPGCPLQAEGVSPEGAMQEGQVRETPGPGGALQVRLNDSNQCGK